MKQPALLTALVVLAVLAFPRALWSQEDAPPAEPAPPRRPPSAPT